MTSTTRKNIGKKIASALGTGLAALITYVTPAHAESGWATVNPAFNLEQNQATVRVEGGSPLGERLGFYGFMDLDPTKEDHVDLENVYGEARLNYTLGAVSRTLENIGPMVELDTGTGLDDFVRAGFSWAPRTLKGNFTLARVFPYSTNDNGPQLNLFSSQELGDRFSVNILGEYNPRDSIFYFETGAEVKIVPKLSVTAQARGLVTSETHNTTPYVGLKLTF